MTPEEERTLREKFMAQRDAPEEDDAEDSFHGRGQLDQDWHDFLQDQEDLDADLLPSEQEATPKQAASVKPSSTVSPSPDAQDARDAQSRKVKEWGDAMMQQFVASINTMAMRNDLPKED